MRKDLGLIMNYYYELPKVSLLNVVQIILRQSLTHLFLGAINDLANLLTLFLLLVTFVVC